MFLSHVDTVFRFPEKDVFLKYMIISAKSINSVFHNLTEDLFIDQGGFYPIAIHKKLLRAISPKIGNFATVIKSSHDRVCASADAIASDHSRKTKRPVPSSCVSFHIEYKQK